MPTIRICLTRHDTGVRFCKDITRAELAELLAEEFRRAVESAQNGKEGASCPARAKL